MWSFWSRNPIKDFPYEIGEALNTSNEDSFWVLHRGKKKVSNRGFGKSIRTGDTRLMLFLHLQATGEDVSIFQFECRPGREHYLENAKSALKRLKTLRHPSILTYIDSMENEKIVCIVTESVMSLREYLRNIDSFTREQHSNAVSYGLYQVAVSDCWLCVWKFTIANTVPLTDWNRFFK